MNDSLDYRTLLGSFATGVTVLTALDGDGEAYGMTASAVSAVSLDPPLLLVCINQQGRLCGMLGNESPFALSILAEDQAELSNRFATSDTPFEGTDFLETGEGCRLIDRAAAHIECRVWDSHEAGDHIVFFGLIQRGEVFDRRPLIHHRSNYKTTSE